MRDAVFGALPDGRRVHRHRLDMGDGGALEVLELGAAVHRLEVRDGAGVLRNVVLGHPTVAERLASSHYLGATIGRYANRIRRGRFLLDGREIVVATHDRGNSLHGGPDGFDRQLWRTREHSDTHVVMAHESPDGHQGFPGRLLAEVRYDVGPGFVRITHRASTDAPTVVNLTNHAYFDLDGEGSGSITEHELTVPAAEYTPTDAEAIPCGGHEPVRGTPFDFRAPTTLGSALARDHPQLRLAHGIDHNLVVAGNGMRVLARLRSARSGLSLELSGRQPGLQVYTGNFFDGTSPGTSAVRYAQHAGIALEPQHFPDSPNRPEFPSVVLRPGQRYRSVIEWRLYA